MEDLILKYEGVAYVVCPACKEPIRTTMVAHAVGHERQAVVDALREAERVGLVSEELKLHLLNLIYKYTAGDDAYDDRGDNPVHQASGEGGAASDRDGHGEPGVRGVPDDHRRRFRSAIPFKTRAY